MGAGRERRHWLGAQLRHHVRNHHSLRCDGHYNQLTVCLHLLLFYVCLNGLQLSRMIACE